jgi:SAM-dependent methyltransferase
MDKQAVWEVERPSTWFRNHEYVITAGMRVLDLASGRGRHSVAAALRGADVVGVESDEEKLADARGLAAKQGVNVTWVSGDLETMEIPTGFDVVLLFNYLDRARFRDFVAAVKPGGWLLAETFLRGQTLHGWGPTNPAHLLEPGELLHLIEPLDLVFGREVTEVIDNRNAVRASVLARRQQ